MKDITDELWVKYKNDYIDCITSKDVFRQAMLEALEKQRELDKYFFERCLQFANETTTNDPLSFEEREYIINFCNTKLEEQK